MDEPFPTELEEQRYLPVSIADEHFLYSLRTDFSLWAKDYPKLLCSIDSGKGEGLAGLLLQGASVVSFVNWVVHKGEVDFTLLLLYVDKNFHGRIYVMREDGDEVCFTLNM
jgi:hypothetical protein